MSNLPLTQLDQIAEIDLCYRDPAYFLNKYWNIVDPVKGVIPFELFPFQVDTLHDFLTYRFSIALKPRQMGMSNIVAGFCGWVGNFHPYKNVQIISIKDSTAKRFLEKIKVGHSRLPDWMRSDITNGKRGDWGTTSLMVYETGTRIESIPTSPDAGRSEALSLLIIDEAAFVKYADEIWAAAYSTLSTGGMCILLSTANGIGNFYHKTWVGAIAGKNNFHAVQLHYTMYPGRDEAWAAEQLRDLGPLRYAQEVLCDFLTSGRCVFDTAIMGEMKIQAELDKPVSNVPLYSFFREMYEVELSNFDRCGQIGRPPVAINSSLIPDADFLTYALPMTGNNYCMAADVALDLTDEADFQALQIVDYDTNEIVLEYFGKLTIRQYAFLVIYLHYFYNGAFTGVESTGVGWSLIELLLEMDFPSESLYTQIRHTKKRRAPAEDSDTLVFGFATTTKSKPVILQNLQNAYEEGSFRQRSVRAIDQHYTFQHLGTGKMGALEGYSDDLVMCSAILQHVRRSYIPYTGSTIVK